MKKRNASEKNVENKIIMRNGEERWGVTEIIGVGVTGSIVLATFVIAIIHVCKGQEESTLLQTLLPLWGTWVGTVLAFYFGKNNLDTATKSYNAVIEKLSPNEKMSSLIGKGYYDPC